MRAARSKGAAVANRVRAIRGHRARLDNIPALARESERLYYDIKEERIASDVGQRAVNALRLHKELVELLVVDRIAAVQEQINQLKVLGGMRAKWPA